MKKNYSKKLWFRRKAFGWGWYPSSWEGWLTTLIYTIMVILLAVSVDKSESLDEVVMTFLFPLAILILTMFYVAYKTGERPRWQWGDSKKKR